MNKNNSTSDSSLRNIFIPLLVAVLFIIPRTGFSQEPQVNETTGNPSYNNIISILPLYLFINGMRVDYDYSINNRHWLQAGPLLFYSENATPDNIMLSDPFTRHLGTGLHLFHRYYPGNGYGHVPVYLSYGPMWQYHKLNYGEGEGINASEKYSIINRIGADVVFGYNIIGQQLMNFDFYIGMGIRYSMQSSNATEPYKYNDTHSAPGFSGTVFTAGIRIGIITSAIR